MRSACHRCPRIRVEDMRMGRERRCRHGRIGPSKPLPEVGHLPSMPATPRQRQWRQRVEDERVALLRSMVNMLEPRYLCGSATRRWPTYS